MKSLSLIMALCGAQFSLPKNRLFCHCKSPSRHYKKLFPFRHCEESLPIRHCEKLFPFRHCEERSDEAIQTLPKNFKLPRSRRPLAIAQGFSLVEMLMALLVASLLLAALAPVMTKRMNENLTINSDVSFKDTDTVVKELTYGMNEEGASCTEYGFEYDSSGNVIGEYCEGTFVVPSEVHQLKVVAIGAGGGGGTAPTAGYTEYTTEGSTNTFTVPVMVNQLEATLISGGAGGGAGGYQRANHTFVTEGNGNVSVDKNNTYSLWTWDKRADWAIPQIAKGKYALLTACGGGGGGAGGGYTGGGGGSGGYIVDRSFMMPNSNTLDVRIGGGGGGGGADNAVGNAGRVWDAGAGGSGLEGEHAPGSSGGEYDGSGGDCIADTYGTGGRGGSGINNINGSHGADGRNLCTALIAGGAAAGGAGNGGRGGISHFNWCPIASCRGCGGGGGGGGGGYAGGGGGGAGAGSGGGGGGPSWLAAYISTANLTAAGGGGGGGGVSGTGPGRWAGGGGGGGGGVGGGKGGDGAGDGSGREDAIYIYGNPGYGGNGGNPGSGGNGGQISTIFGNNYCSGGNGSTWNSGGNGKDGKDGALRVSWLSYGTGGSGGGSGQLVPIQLISVVSSETLTISLGKGATGGTSGAITSNNTITPSSVGGGCKDDQRFTLVTKIMQGTTQILSTISNSSSANNMGTCGGSPTGEIYTTAEPYSGQLGTINNGIGVGTIVAINGFHNTTGHNAGDADGTGTIIYGEKTYPNKSTGGAGGSVTTPWFTCTAGKGGTSSNPKGGDASGYGCGGGGGYGLSDGGKGSGGYARLSWNMYWDVAANAYKTAEIGAGGGGASGNTIISGMDVVSGNVIRFRIGKGGAGAFVSGNTINEAKNGGTTIFGCTGNGDACTGGIRAGGGGRGGSPTINDANEVVNGIAGAISNECKAGGRNYINNASVCSKGSAGSVSADRITGGAGAAYITPSSLSSYAKKIGAEAFKGTGGNGGRQDSGNNANGKTGSGIASGGGGAAIRYSTAATANGSVTSNENTGGAGTNGKIILEWIKN